MNEYPLDSPVNEQTLRAVLIAKLDMPVEVMTAFPERGPGILVIEDKDGNRLELDEALVTDAVREARHSQAVNDADVLTVIDSPASIEDKLIEIRGYIAKQASIDI